jgi:hypothetical protein
VVVVTLALAIAAPAHAALFFLFDRTTAEPGEVVSIRLGGTPKTYTVRDRRPPLKQAIRVYLVPTESAYDVRGRFDQRLHFVGLVRPDRDTRGVLTFRAPPLDSGTYAVASWCPGCATYSRGSTFFAQTIPRVSRYREEMALRVRMPDATERCPVTKGPYGNGLLSNPLLRADGSLPVVRDQDGTLFQKLPWIPHRGLTGRLTVLGERLDAPSPPLKVLNVFWGHSSTGKWSWATPVEFPSEGCWRITGRVNDVTLTYVGRVVVS